MVLFALGLSIPPQTVATIDLVPIARVAHAPVNEMSGLVSSTYPGVFWTLNDSGDQPRIWAIRPDGTVVLPTWNTRIYQGAPVEGKSEYGGIGIGGAANHDWEEIVRDGDRLWICDLGNNGNARRDLAIYEVVEPNPYEVMESFSVTRIPVAYEDQAEFPSAQKMQFDCEAAFVVRGQFFAITKHRTARPSSKPDVSANLYQLQSKVPGKVNSLVKVDSVPDLGGWVTGASVSPDGKTLAVLCQAPIASIWLFSTEKKQVFQSKARRVILKNAKQCEAIAFESNDSLLVNNEQRDLFRVPISAFSPAQVK